MSIYAAASRLSSEDRTAVCDRAGRAGCPAAAAGPQRPGYQPRPSTCTDLRCRVTVAFLETRSHCQSARGSVCGL